MQDFNWDRVVNYFEIRKNSKGYLSLLSYKEYYEKVKMLASKRYDEILVIGAGNKESKRASKTNAIGFIGCKPNTEEVVLLAGSLIRNIEDYRETHNIYEFSSSNRFSAANLNKREQIEKISIRIDIDGKTYTMVLKDVVCKSLNSASVITYLSHNDHRRRYECDLRQYRYGPTKFVLYTERLNGRYISLGGTDIGKINGSYVVNNATNNVEPIDKYIEHKADIRCGVYPFDLIYKEVG